jgi:TolB protein
MIQGRRIVSAATLVALALTMAADAGLSREAARLPAGELLVTRESERGFAIYALRPSGSATRLVATNAAFAAATRDGARIAFVRGDALWTMRRDGSDQRRLLTPPKGFHDSWPEWSPSGATIYFGRMTSTGFPSESIHAIGADGAGLRRLTRAEGYDTCHGWPSASADGRFVAYTYTGDCRHGVGHEIRTVTTAGRPIKLPIRFPSPRQALAPEYLDAAWSPDAATLGYEVNDAEGSFAALYISAADGRPPRRVTTWRAGFDAAVASPAWAPGGDWIAFVRGSDDRSAVWLVRSDGRGLRRVTRGTRDIHVAWLPRPAP